MQVCGSRRGEYGGGVVVRGEIARSMNVVANDVFGRGRGERMEGWRVGSVKDRGDVKSTSLPCD